MRDGFRVGVWCCGGCRPGFGGEREERNGLQLQFDGRGGDYDQISWPCDIASEGRHLRLMRMGFGGWCVAATAIRHGFGGGWEVERR